ncbi:MAG: hypothetical protein LUE20_03720 [Oscillospiraceae bacterium]|nr:hypothetical protein [Oscillospiraceae bacterium]
MVVKCLVVAAALMSVAIIYCCMRVGAIADRRIEALTDEKEQETADDG